MELTDTEIEAVADNLQNAAHLVRSTVELRRRNQDVQDNIDHQLSHLEEDLVVIEKMLGWAIVADRESALADPLPSATNREERARNRELREGRMGIGEQLDRIVPVVEDTYGPRVLDPLQRSVEQLQSDRRNIENQIQNRMRGLLQTQGQGRERDGGGQVETGWRPGEAR